MGTSQSHCSITRERYTLENYLLARSKRCEPGFQPRPASSHHRSFATALHARPLPSHNCAVIYPPLRGPTGQELLDYDRKYSCPSGGPVRHGMQGGRPNTALRFENRALPCQPAKYGQIIVSCQSTRSDHLNPP